jgi:predicted nuclease of predicted toxin-antitoxin system
VSKPRFLADEDLRGSIVHAVRRFDGRVEISTVIAVGLDGADDQTVLDYAWQNHWVLVSHDVNTLKGMAEQRVRNGPGIHGLFLAAQNQSTRAVAESIVLAWSASEFHEWHNRIVFLPF